MCYIIHHILPIPVVSLMYSEKEMCLSCEAILHISLVKSLFCSFPLCTKEKHGPAARVVWTMFVHPSVCLSVCLFPA